MFTVLRSLIYVSCFLQMLAEKHAEAEASTLAWNAAQAELLEVEKKLSEIKAENTPKRPMLAPDLL